MASNHSTSFDLTQEEDDEIVDIENRASSRPRQAAFVPGNLKRLAFEKFNLLKVLVYVQCIRLAAAAMHPASVE